MRCVYILLCAARGFEVARIFRPNRLEYLTSNNPFTLSESQFNFTLFSQVNNFKKGKKCLAIFLNKFFNNLTSQTTLYLCMRISKKKHARLLTVSMSL